jgi:hypothetical protein
VIGAVHDELHARAERAEAADDEPVAEELEVVAHALVGEAFRIDRVVVIGELADLDVRPVHDVA